MTPPKFGVVWARVSTDKQQELSIPDQTARCRKKLEDGGYTVSKIISVSWSSLDLARCSQYLELMQLIQNESVQAVAVFDRDRLSADAMERLTFLSMCKEHHVEVLTCEGAPFIAEEEGMIIELALALGKKRSVLRARVGSKAGIAARVKIAGKPVTFRQIYGYDWDKANLRLIPNADWPTVKLIFDMILGGEGYTAVIAALRERGIPSPGGLPEWNKTGISQMLHSPTYGGRFFALKIESVEPKKGAKTSKRVNSSKRRLSLQDAAYLPNIKIENPPITWTQRAAIFDQLERHQKLASRNANRSYLLRGMVVCGEHVGKNGGGRRYHGQPKHATHYYVCPEGGCRLPNIPGPLLEQYVKVQVYERVVIRVDELVASMGKKEGNTRQSLERDLERLKKQAEDRINRLSRATNDYYGGKMQEEVFAALKGRYDSELAGIRKQQDDILATLATLGQADGVKTNLRKVVDGIVSMGLGMDNIPDSEWRKLFEALHLTVKVNTPDERRAVVEDMLSFADTMESPEPYLIQKSFVPAIDVTIKLAIPVAGAADKDAVKAASDFVLGFPGCDSRNTTYPITLSPEDSTLSDALKTPVHESTRPVGAVSGAGLRN